MTDANADAAISSNANPKPKGKRPFPQRIVSSLECSVRYNRLANWAAKTRQWKRERRACEAEIEHEREVHYVRSAQKIEEEFSSKMGIMKSRARVLGEDDGGEGRLIATGMRER